MPGPARFLWPGSLLELRQPAFRLVEIAPHVRQLASDIVDELLLLDDIALLQFIDVTIPADPAPGRAVEFAMRSAPQLSELLQGARER